MNTPTHFLRSSAILLIAFAFSLATSHSRAHCDTLDGPVVKAAERALAERNVDRVLIWVQKHDEAEIRSAFEQTLVVRTLSPAAAKLADRYFFETLVRVHRAGEGAPYTGLKPANLDPGPAITAGDKALETRELKPLLDLLSAALSRGLEERFHAAVSKAKFTAADVDAGRAYVQAYVSYIHFVEALHLALHASKHEHPSSAKADAAATEPPPRH